MGVRRKGAGKRAAATRRPKQRQVLTLENLDIELRPFKDLGFKPATVVVGISSEGVVGPLVATQIIQRLGMDQVCAMESQMFPPTAMVYFEKPKFPARIYASKAHRLAVVLAEFAPLDEVARPLAYAILAWCEANGAEALVGIDSFPAQAASPEGVPVAAIGATDRDRLLLRKARVSSVQHGAVTGVAGVLLNEGRWWDRDTIVLMASLGEVSDGEAALRTVDVLQRLLPKVPLRAGGPGDEPTRLERAIRAAHARTPVHDYI